MRYPASLPAGHRAFLDRALAHWRTDPRILGAAIGGSFQRDTMDLFSDLDFTLVVAPAAHAAIMAARADYAAQLGPLLAAFTGEHVGEPRLLICLYADPLLHVDLKFVSAAEHAGWVPDHLVLAKPGLPVLSHSESAAAPDRAWIARRIWIWVHYAAAKIGRGELFEALDFLAYLRGTVLGPLCLHAAGQPPYGVRRLEDMLPPRCWPSSGPRSPATMPGICCAPRARRCACTWT